MSWKDIQQIQIKQERTALIDGWIYEKKHSKQLLTWTDEDCVFKMKSLTDLWNPIAL